MTDEEEKQTLLESALGVCMDFTSRLDSVFEGKSDSELVDTIAEIDRIPAVSGMIWYKVVRDRLQTELNYRAAGVAARAAFAAGAPSFCVSHWCDSRQCIGKHGD